MVEEFKDLLKGLRKSRGLTQEQLASALNVPESTIRRYEAMPGTPKRERLELIADYFNVSVDYLMGRTTEGVRDAEEYMYNSGAETIRLLEEQAKRMGLSISDPEFQKKLAHAFNLYWFAREEDR